ncbi:MAG: cadmium-translocating P-type ATPase [Actinobacteria bacterium]|nr:cadmium-translocating P-type ATPase [Actinomycetota bacterium]
MKELFENNKFRWLIVTLAVVSFIEILSFLSIRFPVWAKLPLFLVIIAIFGRKVFISGIKSLSKLDFSNINLLMSIAIFGAIYLRQLEEAVVIVVLFALGNTLEEFGIKRSKSALKELIDNAPKLAQIKGSEVKVPIEEIKIGEIVVIRPGDQIPLDGKVISGDSLVDESTITGESLPKNKTVGDFVYAGTLNGQGYLEAKVEKETKDTTLSQIIDLTFKAAEKKSLSQKFIEKFARIYTPSVIVVSVLLVLVPVLFLGKPFNLWFVQALTLLIIACPCALVISTPISVFSAIGNASRKGFLIKGGRFIEEMGKIKAIALDKTRTLTVGRPVVSEIIPFGGFSKEEVLACAAGLEVFSEHPIAVSILKKAEEEKLDLHKFTSFQAVPGKGLKGKCAICFDKHHFMGNIKFVAEEHRIEEQVLEKIEELEKQGKTAIIIGDGEKIKGVIGVTDEIREKSESFIKDLKDLNIAPVILTGDNKSSAMFVAQKLKISAVKSELLPHEKVDELSKLIKRYRYVGMVGDGVNDAPSLAAASVGIVMGAVGSDVAIENADIALMSDNLQMISYLIRLGRKTVKKIKFNVVFAIGVKFLFLILAVAGWSNLALAIFADVGVTILVVLNSLRLYSYKGC